MNNRTKSKRKKKERLCVRPLTTAPKITCKKIYAIFLLLLSAAHDTSTKHWNQGANTLPTFTRELTWSEILLFYYTSIMNYKLGGSWFFKKKN